MIKKTVLLNLLFMVVFAFGCSSNEDDNETIETQTFLEKYDGVVWLEDSTDSLDTYAYLIQFLNTSKSLVSNEMSDGGTSGPSNCDTESLPYITENTEDTFVQSIGTESRTYTVTNLGKSLRVKSVDTSDPSLDEISYYSRSSLSMDCN
jgi:hypothetical protein|tara:strand:+ start:352 stop:798 length:447 start_codon:yes stop_codon:yes gene_type:complete